MADKKISSVYSSIRLMMDKASLGIVSKGIGNIRNIAQKPIDMAVSGFKMAGGVGALTGLLGLGKGISTVFSSAMSVGRSMPGVASSMTEMQIAGAQLSVSLGRQLAPSLGTFFRAVTRFIQTKVFHKMTDILIWTMSSIFKGAGYILDFLGRVDISRYIAIFVDGFNKGVSWIKDVFSSIGNWFKGGMNTDGIAKFIDTIKSFFVGIGSMFKLIMSIASLIGDTEVFKSIISSIQDFLGEVSSFYTVIWKGIASFSDMLKDKVDKKHEEMLDDQKVAQQNSTDNSSTANDNSKTTNITQTDNRVINITAKNQEDIGKAMKNLALPPLNQ